MMKKILLLISLLGILSANDESAKVVFDLTTSKIKTFEKHIIKGLVYNKTQFENSLRELEAAVVIHGEAYRFFVKDLSQTPYKGDKELLAVHNELKKRIRSMHETYEVEFYICEVGLISRKIELSNVLEFVKIVPSSTFSLVNRQNEGFAYLPVGD